MATKITATPHEAQSPENIFTKGNLVACDTTVVLVTGTNGDNERQFSGVALSGVWQKDHATNWQKSQFTQYKGTVTIEAE